MLGIEWVASDGVCQNLNIKKKLKRHCKWPKEDMTNKVKIQARAWGKYLQRI